MAKRRRHTPEQIVRMLREADRLLGEGAAVADVARRLEVSEQTFHRWRNQYGGLKADDVKRLKALEAENARLKRRVFIADGKGGHQRVVPISSRFFDSLAAYLCGERPAVADTDRVFVVLKGPRRGRPLSAAGLDEIVAGARRRARIGALTCHQLRQTCFARLREAGMALEAIQAQAGHRSIESTRVYLHLADDWLAGEYRRATEAIDAQALGEW